MTRCDGFQEVMVEIQYDGVLCLLLDLVMRDMYDSIIIDNDLNI